MFVSAICWLRFLGCIQNFLNFFASIPSFSSSIFLQKMLFWFNLVSHWIDPLHPQSSFWTLLRFPVFLSPLPHFYVFWWAYFLHGTLSSYFPVSLGSCYLSWFCSFNIFIENQWSFLQLDQGFLRLQYSFCFVLI